MLGSYRKLPGNEIASDLEAIKAANRRISGKNLPDAKNRGYGIRWDGTVVAFRIPYNVNDFNYIENSQEEAVVLDFVNVKFATRSFIDEFYNVFLKTPGPLPFEVGITNEQEDINRIFESVNQTRTRVRGMPYFGLSRQIQSLRHPNGITFTPSSMSLLPSLHSIKA